jgi:hypothetical protein
MSAVCDDEAERTKDPPAGSAAAGGQHAAEDGTRVAVAAGETRTPGSVAAPAVVRSPAAAAAAVDTVGFGSTAVAEALQDMLAAVQ